MTSNQLNYQKNKEEERANRAKESENVRSNKANERLTKRGQNLKAYTEVRGQNAKAATDLLKIAGNALNDAIWYNLDKQLTDDVARISFNTPLGVTSKCTLGDLDIPGISVLSFLPTIGSSSEDIESSVATVAARNIYSFVRHANSGSRNYEAPDLFMYIMGVDQLIALHGALSRIYSVALTAKGSNRYYPKAMLYSLGVDPDDIINHLADLRAAINILGMKINALYIPKDMSVIKRHYWMNTTIHKDQPVKKSQLYVFVQRNFFYYDDVTGSLRKDIRIGNTDSYYSNKSSFYPGANFTFAELNALATILAEKAFQSEDMGIMSGDILKAYGEGGVYSISSIPEDFHIEETYSLEVLSQITNADLTNAEENDFDVKQNPNTGAIYQGTPFYDWNPNIQNKPIRGYGIRANYGETDLSATQQGRITEFRTLNMYKDNPASDEIMVATRLMTGCVTNVSSEKDQADNDPPRLTMLTRYGSEVLLRSYMIWITNGVPSVLQTMYTINVNLASNSAPSLYLGLAAKFDWHPNIYVITKDAGIDFPTYQSSTDFANYASVEKQAIGNMHYVAILSEYGVPLLGNKVRNR